MKKKSLVGWVNPEYVKKRMIRWALNMEGTKKKVNQQYEHGRTPTPIKVRITIEELTPKEVQ